MKLFGGVIVARREGDNGAGAMFFGPVSLAAPSLPIAKLKAMLLVWEIYPVDAGWSRHDVQLVEASPDHVKTAARALAAARRTGGHS